MKFKIFSILAFVFAAVTLHAQDTKELLKTAAKALSAYNLDQAGNADKLLEAKEAIDGAFQSADLSSDYKANLTKAKVNTELMAKDYLDMNLKGKEAPEYKGTGVMALEAIQTALGLAEKKFQSKEVLKILGELTPYLSYLGNYFIGGQDYPNAFEPLSAVLTANNLLTSNGEKSVFEVDGDLDNHKYVTAVCALRADHEDVAEELLMDLYESGSKEPGVYSQLYTLKVEEDEEGAMKILKKGQEIDPSNVELLFAEINYYIKQGKFDVLEEKLKLAIEKDPDNPSVYSALGNVYMNLSETAAKEGDETKRKEYFESALSYYQQTLDRDPNSFDAHYSIGSLHFNQAAEKTKEMQDLGLSKDDQARYTVLEKETAELFAKALPYFKTAEKLNPQDMNTLIALKEIYARQDDFETSNEFKTRLETLQSGGQIEKSYFE